MNGLVDNADHLLGATERTSGSLEKSRNQVNETDQSLQQVISVSSEIADGNRQLAQELETCQTPWTPLSPM